MLIGACATPTPKPGKALPGVLLQANAERVFFAWSPDTPLARSFRRPESLELVADYRSEGGMVTGERLTSANVDKSRNMAVFILPDRLRNVPQGPVCLRMVRNRRQSIPLRVPEPGKSTDVFRHGAWEANAAQRTQANQIRSDLRKIDRNISRLESSLSELQEWQREKQLAVVDQCANVEAVYEVSRPASAVDPANRKVEAQKQCVNQYANIVSLIETAFRPGLKNDTFASELATALARRPEATMAKALLSAVRAHPEALESGYARRLPTEQLGLTTWATNAIVVQKGQLDATAAAAMVSTYRVCLQEATDQFRQAYDAWRAEADGSVAAGRTRLLQEECTTAFAKRDKVSQQLDAQKAEQADKRRELAELDIGGKINLKDTQSLIAADCLP